MKIGNVFPGTRKTSSASTSPPTCSSGARRSSATYSPFRASAPASVSPSCLAKSALVRAHLRSCGTPCPCARRRRWTARARGSAARDQRRARCDGALRVAAYRSRARRWGRCPGPGGGRSSRKRRAHRRRARARALQAQRQGACRRMDKLDRPDRCTREWCPSTPRPWPTQSVPMSSEGRPSEKRRNARCAARSAPRPRRRR